MAIAKYAELLERPPQVSLTWKAALYIRLSREDGDKAESNSITSQREILKEYLKLHPDIELYDFYVDDGWSGTTFDRPDFKRMMEDIYSGRVNCVIAKDLNELGIPNPTRYKQLKGFNYRHPAGQKLDGLWPDSSVRRILRNEVYIGNMVQGKTTISYKISKCRTLPKSDWIVVEDTHEAIIDRETFEKAQSRTRPLPAGGYAASARRHSRQRLPDPPIAENSLFCDSFERRAESARRSYFVPVRAS